MQDMTQYGDIAKAENQSAMSEILRHFSSEYVLSIMNQEIGIFNTNPMDPSRRIQNIVSAIEEEYSYLKDNYPYDLENLTTVRNEMYTNIIQCIAKNFNLIVTFPEDIGPDLVRLAYGLYQFFICDINDNIIWFFSNVIEANIDSLYNALGNIKKRSDGKPIQEYKNPKVADILNNINAVISVIQGMDLTIHDFIGCIPSFANEFGQYIEEQDNFLHTFVFPKLMNYMFSPILISSMKSKIHQDQLLHQTTLAEYLNSKGE